MKNIKKTLIVITLLLIIGIMEITNIIPIGLLQKDGATTVQAYTHNPDNILNNVYEKDGLTILPFIFDSPSQMIQKSFIIEQFQQAGISIKNQESLGNTIVTGNQIITNNKTYTVLIFGDVDQNGIVDSFDALSIIEHIVYGGSSELKGICKLAANVENDSDNLDSFDALRITEFVIGRENKLVLKEPDSMATTKLVPEYEVPTGLTAIKGQTLADVKLPKGFTFEAPLGIPVGEEGKNIFTVTYTPEDTNKYEIVTGIRITITVTKDGNKETPIYVIPEGLEAIEGQTLGEIDLPERFKFEDPLDTLVGEAGESKFKVTYTPEDTDKYEIVTGIEVTITVIKSSVNPPEEDDKEKITGITNISHSETKINQSIYYENTIATIKSTDPDIELTKDTTGDFVYSYDISTYDGDKNAVEVEFSKGDISGEIDIKLYATKAGTYTITPKVSGEKVKGTVKVPAGEEIIVTANEDLTVTDIKLDGKLLSKDTTNEISVITRVEKVATPTIEFYHIYEDNKYPEKKPKPEVKIGDMTSTPVEILNTESCTGYINGIAICDESKEIEVVYEDGKSLKNPYCISMKGVSETATCSFDIKVTNGKNVITRKVNVEVIAKARSEELKVGVNDINLYKNYPSKDESVTIYGVTYHYYPIKGEEGKEKYRVVNEGDKVYTIIPIELFDEFKEHMNIVRDQISNKKMYNNTTTDKIVVLGNDGAKDINITEYIDVKPFKIDEKESTKEFAYSLASNTYDKVSAIGIALKDSNSIAKFNESRLNRI